MSQYWKENSIAIDDNNNIIYIQSAPKGHDEPIVVKVTSCDNPNPKIHFRCSLSLREAQNLMEMLKDIVLHQEKSQSE